MTDENTKTSNTPLPIDPTPSDGPTLTGNSPQNASDLLRRLGFAGGTNPSDPAGASTFTGSARSAPDLSSVVVPGYEILDELGRGGMGVVYMARQLKLNRVVALKMVLGGVHASARLRFLAEAEAVAAVRHPHVVQVHAYGEHDGRPFLEFEYLPGGTLTERLKAGRLTPTAAAELLLKIARGVGAAHDAEVVHRDIKPGNVLFDADGNPKVTDFGLAKRGTSELTNTVAYLGTAFYMSPEQAGGKAKFVGPPADVWALGVILYEALAGVRPFDGEETHDVLLSVVGADPKPPRALAPDVPRDLETVCLKCLDKEPHRRYPNAQAVAADLELFLAGRPVLARPVGPVERLTRRVRRNPALSGLVIVLVAMGLGLFAALVSNYNAALRRVQFEREAKEKANDLADQNKQLADEQQALRVRADALAREAKNELVRADGVTDLLFSSFKSVDPLDLFGDGFGAPSWEKMAKEQNKTVKEFILEFGNKFKDQLKDSAAELTRARLLDGYGNALKNLGELALAEAALREAREIRARRLPPTHPAVWKSELDLGRWEADVGHYQSAIARFRKVHADQVLTTENARLGLTPTEVAKLRLKTKLYEGTTLGLLADKDAIPVLQQLTAERTALLGKDDPDTLLAKLALLGFMLDYRMDAEVRGLVLDLVETMQAQKDSRIRDLGGVTGNLILGLASARAGAAFSQDAANRSAVAVIRKALADGEKTLPANHFILSILRFEMARLLLDLKQEAEADALYARILVDTRATSGLAQPKALVFLHSYGRRLAATNRLADARALYAECEKAIEERFGKGSHWQALLMLRRVELEADFGGGLDAAVPFARRAIELAKSDRFLATHYSANFLMVTARVMSRDSASADARAAAAELFALTRPAVQKIHGAGSREEVILDLVEGRVAHRRGDHAAGAVLIARVEAAAPKVSPSLNGGDTNLWLSLRGEAERDAGRPAAAEGYFRKALDVSRGFGSRDPLPAARDARELAGALVEQGKVADAVPFLVEAQRVVRAVPNTNRDKRRLVALAESLLVAARRTTDPEASAAGARAMAKEYAADTDPAVLEWVGWAVGLAPPGVAWDPAALTGSGHLALALVRVRAKDWAGAEAALAKAGASPSAAALRGLVAIGRGDVTAARAAADEATRQTNAAKPTPSTPFAFAASPWYDRWFARILLDELRAALPPAK